MQILTVCMVQALTRVRAQRKLELSSMLFYHGLRLWGWADQIMAMAVIPMQLLVLTPRRPLKESQIAEGKGLSKQMGMGTFCHPTHCVLIHSPPLLPEGESPTLRPRIWLMAALSFNVHSATTFALISFIYNMNALRGFFMWGFFFSSSFLES